MDLKCELIREACITNMEEYYCDRMFIQMEADNLEDAKCLHEEFVVDGMGQIDQWLFMNDLTLDEI